MSILTKPNLWLHKTIEELSSMSTTAPVIPVNTATPAPVVNPLVAPTVISTITAPVKPKNPFIRFIDAIGSVLTKTAPVVLKVAQEAEPLLALTATGPEYNLVVEAIVGSKRLAQASLAAGVNLTNEQKFGIAVQSATPGLDAILTSAGVTQDKETHINNYIQNIFNLLAGPVVNIAKTVESAGK